MDRHPRKILDGSHDPTSSTTNQLGASVAEGELLVPRARRRVDQETGPPIAAVRMHCVPALPASLDGALHLMHVRLFLLVHLTHRLHWHLS
jgi:hypothetical protein